MGENNINDGFLSTEKNTYVGPIDLENKCNTW